MIKLKRIAVLLFSAIVLLQTNSADAAMVKDSNGAIGKNLTLSINQFQKTDSRVSNSILIPEDSELISTYVSSEFPIEVQKIKEKKDEEEKLRQDQLKKEQEEKERLEQEEQERLAREQAKKEQQEEEERKQRESEDAASSQNESELSASNEAASVQEGPSQSAGLCEYDGNVSSSFVNAVNNDIACVPQYILNEFVSDGWHMYVTDRNIDRTWFDGQYGSVMGVTLYGDKQIFIEDRKKAVREAPVHELGHWFDCHNGCTSDTPQFQEIYDAESDAFCSTYVVNFKYDRNEFFAEAFWKYWTDGSGLNGACPRLYEYLNQLIQL